MANQSAQMRYSAQDERNLMTELWDPAIAEDPERYVLFAFPWGKENTPLHNVKGPRTWQRDELQAIAEHIRNNRLRMDQGLAPLVYQSATVSGRGVGKSALTSWLNLWFMSTVLGGSAINTANTETQLKTRTWAELGKWHTLSINAHWFDKNALSLKPAPWFETALKRDLSIDTGYYYSQAQLWSEENPDAFAGVHNHNGVLVLFDEASGIPEAIYGVTKGFFTEPVLHRYWFAFSNGRRNTGAFFESFHKNRNFWRGRNIDGRHVEGTDKSVYDDIIKQYGDDSDEARVEVKGQFPKHGDKQFISRGIVEAAQGRELVPDDGAPLYMGVDIARYGDDQTVIRFRKGRDARSIPPIKIKGADNMEVANRCAELIDRLDPDAVCIDMGNGTGVIDRLREMGYKVFEVNFGHASPKTEWANYRTYLWAEMRAWLDGGAIDEDADLSSDLAAPEYKFQGQSDRIRLETKEELKNRGFSSPDNGDALACTFHVKVARKDARSMTSTRKMRVAPGTDFKIFG